MEIGSPYDAKNSTDPIIKQFINGEAKGPLTKEI